MTIISLFDRQAIKFSNKIQELAAAINNNPFGKKTRELLPQLRKEHDHLDRLLKLYGREA